MTRVVLVRPWRSTSAGGGCCSADASCLGETAGGRGHRGHDPVGAAYRLLQVHCSEVDVQVVAPSNTGYLLPMSYRAARHRMGRVAAARAALRSTTAGGVLVDGQLAGRVEDLGPYGVLHLVSSATTEGVSRAEGPHEGDSVGREGADHEPTGR